MQWKVLELSEIFLLMILFPAIPPWETQTDVAVLLKYDSN
jgi:hypothetical protein